jgi:tetratricopeptide (TPR) repeat protein
MIARRLALALALAAAPQLASAAPKKKSARAEFDKGVKAYTKGEYQKAINALARSYELEPDEETLFAWAQTERKLGHCDKAIELYGKLLAMNLPAANKDAVREQVKECKEILDAERAATAVVDGPKPPAAETPASDGPTPTPTPTPAPDTAAGDAPASDSASPPDERPASTVQVDEPRAWWKDPVGGALVGVGVVGLAVGTVFLVQGSAAESDKANAGSYDEYQVLADRAESRGRFGVIGLAVGGGLVAGGIIWYATHRSLPPERTVSGWVSTTGGGLALSGRF